MMIDNLKRVVENSRSITKPLYLRNLLKEETQNYILNFVYNSPDYKDLIFTGGTCLRKVYNLPRLSEDLDFDYPGAFDLKAFAADVKDHFVSVLQYKKVTTKISSNQNTVFIKFPFLQELGLSNREEVLFVRCDFSAEKWGEYDLEVSSVSTADFTFFARHYDLPTLFTNKIVAFLRRDFFTGGEQTVSFKARDVFDLVWFIERSKKSDGVFQPNWLRLSKVMDGQPRQKIVGDVIAKISLIDEREIKNDLNPFIESEQSIDALSKSFKEILTRGFNTLIS